MAKTMRMCRVMESVDDSLRMWLMAIEYIVEHTHARSERRNHMLKDRS